jgi:ribonucleoside-diphosphate reductase alpha chain
VEDFIGRQLNGTAVVANSHSNGASNGTTTSGTHSPAASSQQEPVAVMDTPAVRSEQFARFQSDAPACDNCGAITVRNGNCYLCHNCGNSMGCS